MAEPGNHGSVSNVGNVTCENRASVRAKLIFVKKLRYEVTDLWRHPILRGEHWDFLGERRVQPMEEARRRKTRLSCVNVGEWGHLLLVPDARDLPDELRDQRHLGLRDGTCKSISCQIPETLYGLIYDSNTCFIQTGHLETLCACIVGLVQKLSCCVHRAKHGARGRDDAVVHGLLSGLEIFM